MPEITPKLIAQARELGAKATPGPLDAQWLRDLQAWHADREDK